MMKPRTDLNRNRAYQSIEEKDQDNQFHHCLLAHDDMTQSKRVLLQYRNQRTLISTTDR
jgi:hypothetical protein